HRIEASGAHTHPELASTPTPGANRGSFYTRSSDGAPMHAYGATPVVTRLAAASSWEIPLTVANIARIDASNLGSDGSSTPAAIGGTMGANGSLVVAFAAGSTSAAVWECMLPRNYQGGNITVELHLAGDGASSAAA